MLTGLPDIFPVLAAAVAIDAAEIAGIGLRTAMRSGSSRVKASVVDDHGVHAARFPVADAAAIFPRLSSLVSKDVTPVLFVRRVGSPNVQVPFKDSEGIA